MSNSTHRLMVADAFQIICSNIDPNIPGDPDLVENGWQELKPPSPQPHIEGLEPFKSGGGECHVVRLTHALVTYAYARSHLAVELWNYITADESLKNRMERLMRLDPWESTVGLLTMIEPAEGKTWKWVAEEILQSLPIKQKIREWTYGWLTDVLSVVPDLTPPITSTALDEGQKELRVQLIRRDGFLSPIGNVLDNRDPDERGSFTGRTASSEAMLHLTYILPICGAPPRATCERISDFSGDKKIKSAEFLFKGYGLNNPTLALLLPESLRMAYGMMLFCIQTRPREKVYMIRLFVRQQDLPEEIRMYNDRDEIHFGFAPEDPPNEEVKPPNGDMCNIYCALAKIYHAGGVYAMHQAMLVSRAKAGKSTAPVPPGDGQDDVAAGGEVEKVDIEGSQRRRSSGLDPVLEEDTTAGL